MQPTTSLLLPRQTRPLFNCIAAPSCAIAKTGSATESSAARRCWTEKRGAILEPLTIVAPISQLL
jgi:hypothetical protein